MSKPVRILFVTAELAPLVSTGGLAEVAAALPRAFHAQGHDVRVAIPCYRQIPLEDRGQHHCLCKADLGRKTEHGGLRIATVPDTKIPLYLVEHEGYFGREAPYGVGSYEYDDNAERFCFFCQALLDGIKQIGWKPDVVHCHDWHTAPIPIHLKTRFRTDPFWSGISSIFTIHNLAYQGRYGADQYATTGLPPELFTPEYLEYEGDMNLMKGALVFADKITTVSPRYASEIQTVEYGAGLHGVLSTRRKDLAGILNGVDYNVWNPATDPHIAARYTAHDLKGKLKCKRALQQRFGLPVGDAPLFGVVSRLHWQKGFDLLTDSLNDLLRHDMQLVILGTGDAAIEARIKDAAGVHPDRLGLHLGFDVKRAHEVQAGCDFFLMPSRYEPCGLGQLYAMAYGAIPIVRRTGGLADTVIPYRTIRNNAAEATGLSYTPQTRQALTRCIFDALDLYLDQSAFRQVRINGMSRDYSWERSSQAYISLYRESMHERL